MAVDVLIEGLFVNDIEVFRRCDMALQDDVSAGYERSKSVMELEDYEAEKRQNVS